MTTQTITQPVTQTVTPRATRREWLGLAVLALPTLLLSVDVSVLYLALPTMSADLHAGATQQLWILDVYSFLLAGFLVTMGNLGDRIGRRRLLLTGAAAFGLVSIVAAWSRTPEMLIAARALLGVAGATLMPSTMALIRTMFPDPKQMQSAIGVWFACFMGGMTLGPLIGGTLLEHFWWGSAFLVGVPAMVLLLAVGPALLPESRDTSAGRLDLASVGLSLAAILPTVYGLKELARGGPAVLPVAALVAGLSFGVVFVRRQKRLTDPLLDLRLFANRRFSVALSTMLLGGVVMAGISLMSTVYLQTVAGLSPLAAGLWLVPQNVMMIVGSLGAPRLARRFGPVAVMTAGFAISAVGFVLHTQVSAGGGVGLLVAGLVLAAGGMSLPMPLGAAFVLGSAPPEKAGSAASIQETGGEFGVALGVALLGSVGTFVYRSQLAGSAPAGLPADAARSANEGIAGAVGAAQGLGGPLATGLLDAARAAFTSGLHVVAGVGALIFIGMAIAVAVTLRDSAAPEATAPVAAPATDPTTPDPTPNRTPDLVPC